MVAQLLRLRLAIAGNSLRRTPAQLTRHAAAVILGLATAIALAAVVIHVGSLQVDVAAPIITVIGSIIAAIYLLAPLIYGETAALDPRAFALLGIEAKQLSPALAVSAVASVPALAVAIVAFAQIVAWSSTAAFVAVVAAILAILGAVFSARVMSALASFVLPRHRSREFSTVLTVVALVALSPVIAAIVRAQSTGTMAEAFESTASALGFTPFGAAWAAAGAAATGETGRAVIHLVIALLWVLLLAAAGHYLVAAVLVSSPAKARTKTTHGLGWFSRLPATPSGAVAARTLSYWGRDPRYAVSLAIIPIVPVVLVLPLLFAGLPAAPLALIPVPIAALLLGWTLHNDVAYDNTAIWLHIASGVRGVADRFGRAVPTLLIGIPFIAIGALVSTQVYGKPEILPSMFGVGFGILLTGVGVSSVASARFPYPVVAPGSSPFTSPQTSGSTSPMSQSLSFIVILALSSPTLYFAVRGLLDGGQWHTMALYTGIGGGLLVLLIGVFVGGWIFERRSTQLFAFSVRN
jgi:ABC-2 type transport system permease protein